MIYKIDFDLNGVNLVLGALAQQPFHQVRGIIGHIETQAGQQEADFARKVQESQQLAIANEVEKRLRETQSPPPADDPPPSA